MTRSDNRPSAFAREWKMISPKYPFGPGLGMIAGDAGPGNISSVPTAVLRFSPPHHTQRASGSPGGGSSIFLPCRRRRATSRIRLGVVVALALILACSCLTPYSSLAASWGGAMVRVAIRIAGIVTLDLLEPKVTTSGGGRDVRADVEFRVSANADTLWFQAFASDLFKAGDPRSGHFIVHTAGVTFTIPGAMALRGSSRLSYAATPPSLENLNGFTLHPTEGGQWESSSAGTFTRNGVASFFWAKESPWTLPGGAYAGYVKIVAYSVSP